MLHRQTFPVTATRCLFGIVAILWATLAVLVLADQVRIGVDDPRVTGLLAALMLGNGIAMGLFAWLTLRGRRLVDLAAVAVLAINVVLTFTDQIGGYDLAYLALILTLLACLVWGMVITHKRVPSGNDR